MADVDPRKYCPRPVDTATVILSSDQAKVIESLARNIHELWARRRMSEGWVAGLDRDDTKRTHPCLVSFERLAPGEKEYDRTIAAETLKLLVHLGFRVLKE